MVVCLDGGEMNGYLVEYLSEVQKDVSGSGTFICERTGLYSGCHCIYSRWTHWNH